MHLIPAANEQSAYFALACDIVGQQQARRAAVRTGVCYSGMADEAPVVETVEAVERRLSDKAAAREAFFTTPRGRFVKAVNSLGALGYGEADTLLNIYSRTLASDAEFGSCQVDAAGRAIRILTDIGHSHAVEAIRALADLLSPELKAAA